MAIGIICGTVFAVSASATPATHAMPMLGWQKWDAQEVTAFNTLETLYTKTQKDLKGTASVVEGDFRAMSGDAVVYASVADSPDAVLNTEVLNCARSWNSLAWEGFLYTDSLANGGPSAVYLQGFKDDVSATSTWISSVEATMKKDGV